MHPLEKYRSEFPILAERTYLISASLGPLSVRTRAAAQEHLDLWSRYGPEELWMDHALPKLQEGRELFGRMIGAGADEMAVIPSISAGLSSFASCLNYDVRSKIVLSDMDFPTNHYVWRAQQARGAKLEVVRSPDGICLPAETIIDAIDEQTAVVNLNRVLFESSWIMDLPPIVEAAHAAGALVVVDDFHGAGIVPIDVHASGIDVYMAGVLKWLMGGQGLAYLYCRKDLIGDLEPKVVGWFGTKEPFDFDRSGLDLRDDARRFETGTYALPQAWTAAAGLEMVLEVGVDNIRARNQELTRAIIERAGSAGLELLSPVEDDRRGGLVRLRVPGGVQAAKDVLQALFDENVVLDQRGDALRISPHFFNNEADLDLAFAQLGKVLSRS